MHNLDTSTRHTQVNGRRTRKELLLEEERE
jgi:hypothetical protein